MVNARGPLPTDSDQVYVPPFLVQVKPLGGFAQSKLSVWPLYSHVSKADATASSGSVMCAEMLMVVLAASVAPLAGEIALIDGGVVSFVGGGGGGGGGGFPTDSPSRAFMNCTEFCVGLPQLHVRGPLSPHETVLS